MKIHTFQQNMSVTCGPQCVYYSASNDSVESEGQ